MISSNAPHGANAARLRRPVTSPDKCRVALKLTKKERKH
nr:MAG TPA: hypothetical protein [Caudoviricetes sp.]